MPAQVTEEAPHFFVAIYEGRTVGEARLISASADATLVNTVANAILEMVPGRIPENPVRAAVDEGRREALRLVALR